jgi:hypothetical protein
MSTALPRRVGRLERAVPPSPLGPCFVTAPDASAAECAIERLRAEHGDRLPRTLFVMIRGRAAE